MKFDCTLMIMTMFNLLYVECWLVDTSVFWSFTNKWRLKFSNSDVQHIVHIHHALIPSTNTIMLPIIMVHLRITSPSFWVSSLLQYSSAGAPVTTIGFSTTPWFQQCIGMIKHSEAVCWSEHQPYISDSQWGFRTADWPPVVFAGWGAGWGWRIDEASAWFRLPLTWTCRILDVICT